MNEIGVIRFEKLLTTCYILMEFVSIRSIQRRNCLKQKTNSNLAKKQTKKMVEYNHDDLESNDEWIVENDDGSSKHFRFHNNQ